MTLKFDLEIEGEVIPYHIVMHQIPFEPAKPIYYVAIFGNSENMDIKTFYNLDAKVCFEDIRTLLSDFHYVPKNIVATNILEPREEFAQYIQDFSI